MKNRKKLILSFLIGISYMNVAAQRLIVRADDIGMSHASNVGVIKSYTDGITTSVELMVVTPWLPEAVKMLKKYPKLNVGLHVAFTSDWENMKWRPLTKCPTLTDENGYFLLSAFPNPNYPGESMIERKDEISLAEFETEFRAQIELALKLMPRIDHISGHMRWGIVSPEITASAERISGEYGLLFADGQSKTMQELQIDRFPMPLGLKPGEREAKFIDALDKLERGKTYLFVEHPAMGGDEMEGIFHKGYENVSVDRQDVLDLFTNLKIQTLIKERGIELISYRQLIEENHNKKIIE